MDFITNNITAISEQANNSSAFTEEQKSIIFSIVIIGSIFSIIGTGATILTTILFNNFSGKNKIWNRIIFFLCLCDLCGSIDLLLGKYFVQGGDELCRYQGLRIQFFFLASALWTNAIAFTIFFIVVMKKKIHEIERYEYIYHIVIWGICFLTIFYLYLKDIHHYKGQPWIMGDTIFWCWITNHGSKLRLYFFFGPLWFIFLINTTMYVTMKIICKRRNISASQIYGKNTIASRWHLYLLVLIVTWIWGTINRIQNSVNEKNPIFALYLLHSIFTPLQGFLNSMVYFWCTGIKYFIDLYKNICKEESDIEELRRRRHHLTYSFEEGESGKKSSSHHTCSNKHSISDDPYDNYFVYNPKPVCYHHSIRYNRKKKRSKRRYRSYSQPQMKPYKDYHHDVFLNSQIQFQFSQSHPHSNSNSRSHSHSHSYSHCRSHSYSHSHSHSHSQSHSHSHSQSLSNSNSHTYTHSDSNSNSHTYTHSDSNSNSHTYTHSDLPSPSHSSNKDKLESEESEEVQLQIE